MFRVATTLAFASALLLSTPLAPTQATTPGAFTVVGHHDLGARGDNAALAIAGPCAYVGFRGFNNVLGMNEPVLILNIVNPAAPTVVGAIPGTVIAGSTARELRAADNLHRLYVMFYYNSIIPPTNTAFANGILIYDIADCEHPVLLGTYDMAKIRPHEFFLWQDPLRPGRVLAYVTIPFGPPQLLVADLSDPAHPLTLTTYEGGIPVVSLKESDNLFLGNYVHSLSVTPDGTRGHLAYWDAGYLIVDTSLLAGPPPLPTGVPLILPVTPTPLRLEYAAQNGGNTHSAVQLGDRAFTLLVDEAYNGIGRCPYGWVHLVDTSNPLDLHDKQVAQFKLPQNDPAFCNGPHDGTWTSHNPTVTADLALVPWHAGGLVAIDVADPVHPSMLAQFVPDATQRPAVVAFPAELQGFLGNFPVLMWSYPIVRNGHVFVVDIRNGLYVLDYAGPHAEELAVPFLEGNSNTGAILAAT